MGRRKAYNLLLRLASSRQSTTHHDLLPKLNTPGSRLPISIHPNAQQHSFKALSSLTSPIEAYAHEYDTSSGDFDRIGSFECREEVEDEASYGKIPIKAFFISTSINLRSMQAENVRNILPPSSRASNYIALRFHDEPLLFSSTTTLEEKDCYRYILVFQYGSTVFFNIEDDEVGSYLDIVRRHASGLLPEMTKDDYALKEDPALAEVMQGDPDCIVLRHLDIDAMRVIGSIIGQSIALDYFVSQVDAMVGEFAHINREMEKSGNFTMDRKKLFQLVGKANSNLADIILKVGFFDRSEIAWRDATCAQIHEYLREEYELTQRFGNLDYKLKFVEHNIHFLQEVLQNRKSDLLEWCIILLLAIENLVSIYEIMKEAAAGSL